MWPQGYPTWASLIERLHERAEPMRPLDDPTTRMVGAEVGDGQTSLELDPNWVQRNSAGLELASELQELHC